MWYEVNIFSNEPDCKRSWITMLYFHFFWCYQNSVSGLWNLHQSSDQNQGNCKLSFYFMPCLRYEIFGAGAQFTPPAPQAPLGMLRRELREKIKFQWKNKITHFFLKRLELTFIWQSKGLSFSWVLRYILRPTQKELSNRIRLGDTKKSYARKEIF